MLRRRYFRRFAQCYFNSFGFDGMVASFYTCDETLEPRRRDFTFDTGDVPGEQKIMSDYQLSDI
jgi:hypothetical protein